MIIHYICRGNAFRSIMAEAYTNSLQLPRVSVRSSGTVASEWKERNKETYPMTLDVLARHGVREYAKDHYADDLTQELIDDSDIIVCINQRVLDEAMMRFTLPDNLYVWDVADINEPGREAKTPEDAQRVAEIVFREISSHVDSLVKALKLSQ